MSQDVHGCLRLAADAGSTFSHCEAIVATEPVEVSVDLVRLRPIYYGIADVQPAAFLSQTTRWACLGEQSSRSVVRATAAQCRPGVQRNGATYRWPIAIGRPGSKLQLDPIIPTPPRS
jgi:hypothetical protein